MNVNMPVIYTTASSREHYMLMSIVIILMNLYQKGNNAKSTEIDLSLLCVEQPLETAAIYKPLMWRGGDIT